MKVSQKTKIKIGQTLASKNLADPEPTSLLNLSSRTTAKILYRMFNDGLLGCSRCGWNLAIGDIHHINGRQIADADNHINLCYLCPNCHRLAHAKKIEKSTLIPLSVFLGDSWKSYYYGFRGPYDKEAAKLKREQLAFRKQVLLRNKENRKALIQQSGIDFKKFGWVNDVSKIIGISPQRVSIWMKRNMHDFYYRECFIRKS